MSIEKMLEDMSAFPTNLHSDAEEGGELSYSAGEFGTIEDIVNHINAGIPPVHVYSASLRENGNAVQEKMEKYLADERFGSSVLKAALKSELHLLFSQSDDKEELEKLEGEKSYFNLGDFLHQCLLEPTKFGRAIVEPTYSLASHDGCDTGIAFWKEMAEKELAFLIDNSRHDESILVNEKTEALLAIERTKDLGKLQGKKDYIAALKDFCDLYPVSEQNFLKIQILKKHVDNYAGGIIHRLLKHSKREISMYYDKYKIRPDALQFEENIGVNAIISVKSTAQEDLRGYFAQQAKLHYDLSEAMYLDIASKVTGRNFNTVINIMLQTCKPFGVAVLIWSPDDLEMGNYKYEKAKEILARCEETQVYRSYDMYAEEGNMGLIQMKLPNWNSQLVLNSSITA